MLSPSFARAGKAVEGVVNLNTAPPEVLALLPGVGPAKAVAILAYRKRRPFRTVDELVRIKGLGRKMVRRLRPHLAVAGPTTATAATATLTPAAPTPAPPPAVVPNKRPPVCLAGSNGHPPSGHLPNGSPATARLRARSPGRQPPAARPWRAACLGPP
ncbi:MAG TPA: helix-hairpin-helix domain-containing protein [Polyangia bacterium]|nr:helix-hairpin-helix domain-containing protein [Polyangia bacterium]